MKIAFVGKGGSGKTTISALLGRQLAYAGFPVVMIDADINQHLGQTLGMNKAEAENMRPMGLEINRIKEYLRGNNPLISNNDSMIKTTPPGLGSRFITVTGVNPMYRYFSKTIDGIRLMAVGQFDESDLGVKCYHSKTGSVELLLNHLIDGQRDYVIVDMTAGADSFASGLFTRFDITFLVVEPTTKSVSVFEQYKKYAKDFDVQIKVIGNKIENQKDIDFIKQYVGGDLVAVIKKSPFVKKIDRGQVTAISNLEAVNKKAMYAIISVIDEQKKDWEKFYRQAVEFHIRNAKSWANSSIGKDVTKQIDPTFNFKDAISL
jgi:CO dehydrogenase maturation factor